MSWSEGAISEAESRLASQESRDVYGMRRTIPSSASPSQRIPVHILVSYFFQVYFNGVFIFPCIPQ